MMFAMTPAGWKPQTATNAHPKTRFPKGLVQLRTAGSPEILGCVNPSSKSYEPMSDDQDPHGTRGSTQHHALDYKKEVKKFSSADILAAYKSGKSSVPSLPKEPDKAAAGAGSESSAEFHALDYKKEVKKFSSADLVANVSQAKRSGFAADSMPGTEPSAAVQGASVSTPSAPSPSPSPASAAAAAVSEKPAQSSEEAAVKVRPGASVSWAAVQGCDTSCACCSHALTVFVSVHRCPQFNPESLSCTVLCTSGEKLGRR